MQFVPARFDYSTDVKASVEKGGSLPFGAFICLVFTHQRLDLLREQTADRSPTAYRQDFDLPEHLPTETYRYGKPVAKLVPAKKQKDDIFGYTVRKAKIVGDIVGTVTPLDDWESK
jgi:hypothetical protein